MKPDLEHAPGVRRTAIRQHGMVLALAMTTGCSMPPPSSPPRAPGAAATTRPGDIVCPDCTVREHIWDERSRRGRTIHHDVYVMQCPDCQVRAAGVCSLPGPSHTCSCCPAGVDRCPMCRATTKP